jgi:hypothetical protein
MLAARTETEDPLFVMLVGPSSAGKTTILSLTKDIAVTLDSPTLPGILAQEGGQRVGVLAKVGARGTIVIPDFSTILSLHPGAKEGVLAAFRRIADGDYSRTMYGKDVTWQGKATVFAACTSAIDAQPNYNSELGTRFIYMRLNPKTATERVWLPNRRSITGVNGLRGQIKTLLNQATPRAKSVIFKDSFTDFLKTCAEVTAIGRVSVPRHSYNHEVLGTWEVEEPYRVYWALEELARCLIAMGDDEATAGALCARVARDTMPTLRRSIIKAVSDDISPLTNAEISKVVKTNRNVVYRGVEDLEMSGLLTRLPGVGQDPSKWCIAGQWIDPISRVFNA